jgi:hypothetical protein
MELNFYQVYNTVCDMIVYTGVLHGLGRTLYGSGLGGDP